jgi:predicted nuclease of predicted toxin-antitoxin system
MRFLTDENIYPPMVAVLRELGHDVFDIKEQQLFGIDDDQVIKMAHEQNRILITLDKGFSNILLYQPGTHPGIIVLRVWRLTITKATDILRHFIEGISEVRLAGKLAIVEPSRVRFRS